MVGAAEDPQRSATVAPVATPTVGADTGPPDLPDADPDLPADAAPPSGIPSVRGLALLLPALPPLVWMTSIVLSGSPMQFNDYWFMIDRTFRPDGLIDIGGLFTFQNEHPIVLPQLLYWVNAQLTGGSNIVLGLIVIAVVAAQIVLISRFVPDEAVSRATALGLVAVAGLLLFSRQGTHNFWLAMSGTAWLLANLLVIAALFARWRGRITAALALAVLASMTYGTGLMVWPALVVTGMVVDRRRRPEPLVLGIACFVAIGYFLLRDPVPEAPSPSLYAWLRATGRVGGSVVAASLGISEIIGYGVIALGLVLCVVAVRSGRRDLAPWMGLFTFALGSTVLIAQSRFGWIVYFGHQSRYASITALLLLSVAGLGVALLRYRPIALLPLAALGLAAVAFGADEVAREREYLPAQEEFAAAMHLDLADGRQYALFVAYPRVAPLLERLGHYPFDGTYDGDCGLAGQPLPRGGAVEEEEGHLDAGFPLDNGRGVRLVGWVPDDRDSPVACVVITDDLNRVVGYGPVGAGSSKVPWVDADRAFAAVAPIGSRRYQAYAVQENGVFFRLDGVIESPG